MLAKELIKWTKDYMNSFGGQTKAVIGISGGKDSTIVAKLLIKAIGHKRVYLVTIPNGLPDKKYIADIDKVEKDLKHPIDYIDIGKCYDKLTDGLELKFKHITTNSVFTTNTPARLRMVVLYSCAAALGDARVVCTGNRSEDYIGWATKYGDMAGDLAPLANLTVREVKLLGYQLGVDSELIEKIPDDGMCGKSDEDKLGFSYKDLDDYLLYGAYPSKAFLNKVEKRHKANLHKLLPMPKYEFKDDKES